MSTQSPISGGQDHHALLDLLMPRVADTLSRKTIEDA
jgi:hypothetical protein